MGVENTLVTVTGSGVPTITPGRAGAGVLVRCGDIAIQFDAGRATGLRLAEAGVATPDLDALFVTHHHSDHLTGLVDVVFSRWVQKQSGHVPLPIVAPNGPSIVYLERMLDPWADDIEVRLQHTGRPDGPSPEIIGFDAPEELRQIWAGGGVRVSARSVRHEPVTPAIAYRIDTPDGSVVISGDTRVCDEVEQMSTDVQLVVHEAFRTDLLMPRAARFPQLARIADYHANTKELGASMARAAVPMTVLTHLIPAPTAEKEEAGFVDDLHSGGYLGEVIVARDLTTIQLRDGATSIVRHQEFPSQ